MIVWLGEQSFLMYSDSYSPNLIYNGQNGAEEVINLSFSFVWP